MSAPSDPRTLVLHGLRLKGAAEPEVVAATVEVDEDLARTYLQEMGGRGLVSYREGRLSGYSLTPQGRAEHARLLAEELDRHGARPAVGGAHRAFLDHNQPLLEVCTAWQLRPVDGQPVVNDHADPGYDEQVIDRLGRLHEQVEPICAQLTAALQRFRIYAPRLGHAVARLRAGDLDWFTKPMIPSYHTVWFELHEDLLATLGIERGQEEAV